MSDIDKPDLGAVLDHYGVVYRPGRNSQKCICPVHQETRESCSINLSEGWYNCHACQSKGDVFNLIMEMENCNFASAKLIAEGFAHTGSRNIRTAGDPRTDGLFGRTRPERRDDNHKQARPSLRTLERS